MIKQFIKLNQTEGNFQKVPVGRYINFVADYLANEKDSTREQAIIDWKKLKELDIPKDFECWKRYKNKQKGTSRKQ